MIHFSSSLSTTPTPNFTLTPREAEVRAAAAKARSVGDDPRVAAQQAFEDLILPNL